MKYAGILILALGVGISAAFAARQTDALFDYRATEGRAHFLQAEAGAARDGYCDAREQAGLAPDAPCKSDEEAQPAGEDEMRDAEGHLPPRVAERRTQWLDAKERAREPSRAAQSQEPPGQSERLQSWLAQSGAPFGLGLLLVLAGAIIGRIGVRREVAESDGSTGATVGVADFGRVLEALRAEVAALVEESKQHTTAREHDEHRVRARIETLQADKIEPLIDARQRFQLRYGLTAFAAVFEPLSSGERKLNRAWSALVDHHWGEAMASLEGAASELARACETLQQVAAVPASEPN